MYLLKEGGRESLIELKKEVRVVSSNTNISSSKEPSLSFSITTSKIMFTVLIVRGLLLP